MNSTEPRWGIRGSGWINVSELPTREDAYGWARAYASGERIVEPEPMAVYVDRGDGWTEVETFYPDTL